jgi:hypothetical protein
MFNQSYNPTEKTFVSSGSSSTPHTNVKMCDIFTNIESATAQACFIYNAKSSLSTAGTSAAPSFRSDELEILLNNLQSTVSGIPPFALGENTLVWVYSVAASLSAKPKHCAFFASRLTELLSRVGHQDIPGYLTAVSIL